MHVCVIINPAAVLEIQSFYLVKLKLCQEGAVTALRLLSTHDSRLIPILVIDSKITETFICVLCQS
jgi:hypothetical protein